MKRKLGYAVLVLLALAVPAFWWFIMSAEQADGRWPIDVAELRKAARSVEGELPTEVHVEKLLQSEFPKGLVIAGAGFSSHPMRTYAYQLVYPSRTALVDTAMDEATARAGVPVKEYDGEGWKRLQAALTQADFSVFTHEHFDHIGGALVNEAAWEKAIVNKEQLEHPELVKPLTYPVARPKTVLDYEGIKAVAPGVVLIRAGGHTPGSQMVYVQLESGAELLFLGDVAWSTENVERVRERPRGVTAIMNEDRHAVLQQLAALNALKQSEPKLMQVPGHDVAAVDALIASGAMKTGFVVQPP